jgi:hypothetical protein
MSITNDLIERTNKLFERMKYDPEFQYVDTDFETKELIVDIDKGDDDPDAPDDIYLVFTVQKIKVIKNINMTPNLTIYPYFLDFLPMRMIENEIKYIVKDKLVTRDEINMMLFQKECVNNNKNIKFMFPKNCVANIPNKLYIHEFGREIIHLTINYIHSKTIDKLITNNLYYDTVIKKLENLLVEKKEEEKEKDKPVKVKAPRKSKVIEEKSKVIEEKKKVIEEKKKIIEEKDK